MISNLPCPKRDHLSNRLEIPPKIYVYFLGSLFLSLILWGCSPKKGSLPLNQKKDLVIAVSSNFHTTLEKILKNYSGKVRISSGASGNLFAQIQQGAPYHIFFSADTLYPQKLWEQGKGVEKPKIYGYGKIAFWVHSRLLPSRQESFLKKLFISGSLKNLAFPNPQIAPYGRKAKEIMIKNHVWERWKKKLRFGKNVSQTAQIAEMGYADGAILPLSIILGSSLSKMGAYYLLPEGKMPQSYIILKAHPSLKRFLHYFHSTKVEEILENMGYALPKSL